LPFSKQEHNHPPGRGGLIPVKKVCHKWDRIAADLLLRRCSSKGLPFLVVALCSSVLLVVAL
jgi:hypothetical protein